MNRVSTKLTAFLALLLLWGSVLQAESLPWPLKRNIDLSSGFGDFRSNRFHAGVDLRTGGAVGAKVYSPVDGYIWRVKMSYRGYGKGLYIKGDDAHFYVLAHLDRFNNQIESIVRERQFERERYYLDINFPRDSIRVKKGELVAYSGKTGIGAPHLHFEKRSPDNVPINPLTHGFVLNDTIPPSFERIGFQMLDDRSLFPGGVRKFFLPVRKVSSTEFVLDTVLYMSAPFGVLAHCYDQMRPGGMRQAVKRLSLKLDGEVRFEVDLDSLPFEVGPVSALAYDMTEVARDEKRVRNLFDRVGRVVADIGTGQKLDGTIGGESFAIGEHTGQLVATDHNGNRSTLSFDFIYGPATGLYVVDTCIQDSAFGGKCYLSPTFEPGSLLIDSNTLDICLYPLGWNSSESTDLVVRELNDGWLVLESSIFPEVMSARVTSHMALGCATCSFVLFDDAKQCYRCSSLHPMTVNQVSDEGLIVGASSPKDEARNLTLTTFSKDAVPQAFSGQACSDLGRHGLFIPVEELPQRVDSFHVRACGADARMEYTDLQVVRPDRPTNMVVDSVFRIGINRDDLFQPQLIGVVSPVPTKEPNLVAGPYRVLPKAFPVQSSFELSMNLDPGNPHNPKAGLCWYDDKEHEWVWIDNGNDNDNLVAGSSLGGGKFAAIVDNEAPTLRKLNLKQGHKYWNAGLRVKFQLEDNLSGFEDDRSLDVRINGDWLLPEFDIEDGEVIATQRGSLSLGQHLLTIRAVDRAGNEISRRVEFEVIKRSN